MKIWKIIVPILVLLWLDWWSKYLFYTLKFWEDFLLLNPVFNTGISRWMSANLSIIIVISFVGLGLFYWLWRRKNIDSIGFIFLIAGTLWNLLDRIVLGWVRDFISIGNFPVFNLADCYLTIAVCWIIWTSMKDGGKKH